MSTDNQATLVEEYPNEPDDGHECDFGPAEGVDTGTDADAVVCKLCGCLSALDLEDEGEDLDISDEQGC
jgi:hypothetical protein